MVLAEEAARKGVSVSCIEPPKVVDLTQPYLSEPGGNSVSWARRSRTAMKIATGKPRAIRSPVNREPSGTLRADATIPQTK